MAKKRDRKNDVVAIWPALGHSIFEALYGQQLGTVIEPGYDEKGRKLKMTISQAKARSILNGLTSIAENVYEHVTGGNVITTAGVISSLHAAGKNADRRKIEGCLQNLKRKGLVNEPSPGTWIRVQIHAKDGTPLTANREHQEYKPVVKRTKPVAVPSRKPVEVTSDNIKLTAIGKLQQLKGELAGAGEILMDIEGRLDAVIAECIDDAKSVDEDMNQLRQLKTLLKGIAD